MESIENPKRIIVIDDNPDIHNDYRKILSAQKEKPKLDAVDAFFGEPEISPSDSICDDNAVVLDSAYQGQEGLERVIQAQAEGKPYAMAFVDMRMPPGWDGLQTIEEMWKVAPDLQVVICTAYSDNTWDQIIKRVGKSDKLLILKKPFDRIEVSQLAVALTEKWALAKQARMRQEDLERLVHERTEQLEFAAQHDPLTKLANRSKFNEDLENALAKQKSEGIEFAVCVLDLDRFKQVNDTLGHPIGDELLMAVSRRLESCFRASDTIARLGGDEFAVLCPNEPGTESNADDSAFSLKNLERVQQQMCEPYSIEGHRIACGMSMGIALVPADGDNAEEILQKADLALYLAKHDGRGQFCMFDASAHSNFAYNRELASEITIALEQEQFELYYQPLVDSQTRETECMEALIRWHHPSRDMVSPLEFITAAEQSGQIIDIGEWVLKQACMDATRWPEKVSVAVNVSAVQFRDERLASIVVDALSASGLAPERLELELTETAALQACDKIMETLHLFREMGVRIVLDDFGTGHASLSYLRQFQFDKIKLDRSFVNDAVDSEEARLILKAVAGLGKSLGIHTTAEGVETEKQEEMVLAEGYSQMQGYLFSRPLPKDQFDCVQTQVFRQREGGLVRS